MLNVSFNKIPNFQIWRINTKYNILYVHGPCVPGECHTMVRVYDTCLPTRKPKHPPPMPTWLPEDSADEVPEEMFDDKLHQFAAPSIQYEEEQKSWCSPPTSSASLSLLCVCV